MSHRQIKTVFIHGFLGDRNDWKGIARAGDIMLDLPIKKGDLPKEPCHLVGYSMGGRVALRLKKLYPKQFVKTVIISAHPGLEEEEREKRWEEDLARAKDLREGGLQQFLTNWYKASIFASFRASCDFGAIVKKRGVKEKEPLASLLLQESVAKQPSFWKSISGVDFVIGAKDDKYMALVPRLEKAGALVHIAEKCGHVLHLEDPTWCRKKLEEILWKL